jgi:serine/threonine protein kinase
VVVKRILPHLAEDPRFVKMFVAEARLSARLSHVNIVPVYELDNIEGEYCLCMEYVRGRDLATVIRAHRERAILPPGFSAYVLRETCRALAYAHALADENGRPFQLVHRDVSPSNVMLSFDGSVKLLDFGIAKALAESSEHKTQTGTLKGKVSYMSPEQIDGKDIDHRSDLFAAGIVLHELLADRRLFRGENDFQTAALVREAHIPPPSASNSAVPPELDRITMKALARDLAQRYQSGDEMAADLDSAVYELKWGPARVAELIRALFPDELSHSDQLPIPELSTRRERPPLSERQKPWLAVGALGVALSAVALVGTLRPASQPVGATTATRQSPKPDPAAPTTVEIRVVSKPPGAEVLMLGETQPRGRTPLIMSLPRSAAAAHLVIRTNDFQPGTLDFTPNADAQLELTLTPLSPPEPAGPVAAHASRPAPKPAKKQKAVPNPDLKNGDLVDPYLPR